MEIVIIEREAFERRFRRRVSALTEKVDRLWRAGTERRFEKMDGGEESAACCVLARKTIYKVCQ